MKHKQVQQQAIQQLIAFWKIRYPALHEEDEVWLLKVCIVRKISKGKTLYYEGQEINHCYIVIEGLLIKAQTCQKTNKRQILSIAKPNMAFFTTSHPYSYTGCKSDIIAIRPTLIIQLPYSAIRQSRPHNKAVETLMTIFIHKKKYQQDMLHKLFFIYSKVERSQRMAKLLPELYWLLSLTEQADLLNISQSTAKRARKKL